MSSINLPTNRKRLRSPDFRDSDSEDEVPPLKLKKYTGADIHVAFKAKLRNFAIWVCDLPVKSYFAMAIKSGTKLSTETIVIDEEDEDDDEVSIQEVKKCFDPDKLNPLIDRFENPQKLFPSQSMHSRRRLELNESSYSLGACFDRHRVNGSSSKDWDSKFSGNGYYPRQSRTDNLKCQAMVSNPATDIEILLGSEAEIPAPDVDEIEILSESSSTMPKHVSSQKSHRISRLSTAKDSVSGIEQSKNHTSSVKRLQSSSPQNFTANEVVRLHDKAQYQLLLEKYISGSYYHHMTKKKQSNDGVRADSNLFPGRQFKKEVLQQPVDKFIENYYKEYRMITPENAKETVKKEPVEVKIEDDDEDDDLQILEVKLPKVRPIYKKSIKYFTPEWISQLKHSLHDQTEERLKIVADQERTLERFKKERLLNQLRVVDTPGQAEEFPELTPEMEEEVDQALSTGAPDEVLCRTISDTIRRKDIITLDGLAWLNDSIINSYFDLIVERSTQDGYPSIYAFTTFFYSNLKHKGYAGVKRWTRKINIFSYDLNFVPIHLGVHWCLAIIDHRKQKISYYDSMGNGEEQCGEMLQDYLVLELKDKQLEFIADPDSYTTETMKDIPQQMNGSDCGMFTLKYAEYISRDAEITFNQSHMAYFRRRMVYELLKSKLL